MSPFQFVTLTPAEELSGQILSAMQLGVLQNLRVAVATQKINLEFTPNDVLSFTQQEAFLKGQLELLQYLIDTSEAATKVAQSNPY